VATSFHNLSFLTRPGEVMTPRRTTEELVERARERIGDSHAHVADVGTGSGAIAVTLALLAPRAVLWASDVSEASVELARANAERLGVGGRVKVVQGDLLDPIPPPLDLVVANLPYLPDSRREAPEYRDLLCEPCEAVFAPGDGLGPYRRLLAASADRLAPGGALLIQLRGSVVEAERDELPAFAARLPEPWSAAA
jgi:release factor glutamine methyltransferase